MIDDNIPTDLPKKRFFRVDEVARIFGFSKDTVRRWAREEKIEHKHFSGVIVIPYSEVIRMLTEGVPKKHE
jgi:excisionase family DNA binding protein